MYYYGFIFIIYIQDVPRRYSYQSTYFNNIQNLLRKKCYEEKFHYNANCVVKLTRIIFRLLSDNIMFNLD